MKRKLLYTGVLISAIVIVFRTIVFANSGGAPAGVAGAPDDQVTNSCGNFSCHSFVPIVDDPSFTITMLDPGGNIVSTYKLNTKYTVRIEMRRPSIVDCGFEATIETPDQTHVGKLTSKLKSQVTFGDPNYITHSTYTKTSAGYAKWEFYWTSPKTTNPGDITIYASGNDGDGNDNQGQTGDSIFNTSKTYSHNSGISTGQSDKIGLNLFPNPATDHVTITYNLAASQDINISIFNVKGQVASTIKNDFEEEGSHTASASVNKLPSGIYYLKIMAGDETSIQKLMVNRE